MTDNLSIALAQINPTVGDIGGNVEDIREGRAAAARQGADLVIFGELAVAGYPPEDLVLKKAFQESIETAVRDLAADTADGGPAVLVGAPWRVEEKLYNAALLLAEGRLRQVVLKHELPNYGVFDEVRVFNGGPLPEPVAFGGLRLGVMVCEDMWKPNVTHALKEAGADLLVVINGSPFDVHKIGVRRGLARERASQSGLGLIYVNLVGGQDELVFDGTSFVMGANGEIRVQAHSWREDIAISHWRARAGAWACEPGRMEPRTEDLESIYRALMLGLGDYVDKNRFPGVIIGLSGGIDSALTAAIAVDSLGADRVHLVVMPSPYTSKASLEDAAECARLLGAGMVTVSIEPAMAAFETMLKDLFAGRQADETEENIQARARGITLMALSNKFGYMVLSTGNKSEMSVGYATLYGDMCGGFSVLKDIYKTTVYALSRWRNQTRPGDALGPAGRVMPERVLTKAPSAELKPGQTDQDTLPPYDELDAILKGLVEDELSLEDLVLRGHEAATVKEVWRMLDRAEYKRRQAPPGVKITSRAFGRDRRYPITNRFTG